MSKVPDLVVIASSMVDMICYADVLPSAGQTITGTDFVLGFGGKGANQAVMARRLGSEVHLTACLGDDVFAHMALDHYGREGLDLDGVRTVPDVTSGVAPIWVDSTGENRIVVVPGANAHLSSEQAAEAVERPAQVDVVLSQMEVPQRATVAAFAAARRRGATTILNPAPALPPVSELLDLTDWIVLNESEFTTLTGTPVGPVPESDPALVAGAETLRARAVLTLGAAGAAIIDAGEVSRIKAPRMTQVVDTTGAGDAFVGAFAHLIGAGVPPESACRIACDCASLSVTRRGTQASFPTPEEAARLARREGRPARSVTKPPARG